jgi:hypothetical protein
LSAARRSEHDEAKFRLQQQHQSRLRADLFGANTANTVGHTFADVCDDETHILVILCIGVSLSSSGNTWCFARAQVGYFRALLQPTQLTLFFFLSLELPCIGETLPLFPSFLKSTLFL